MSGKAMCQQHPESLAINQCMDCFAPLCQPCTLFDGFQAVCRSCLEKRKKEKTQGRILRALVAAVVIGGVGGGIWWMQNVYVPPFDYGEWTAGVTKWTRVLEKEPCDRNAVLELTEVMLKAGDNRGVVDRANQFLAACGDYPRLRWMTYEGHKRLSEWDQAAAEATKLIESDPYDKDFRWWRGFVYEQKGDLDKAAEDYRQSIILEPRLNSIPINLADVEERRGKPCDAIFPLEQLLFYYPDARSADKLRSRVSDLSKKGNCGADSGTAKIQFTPGSGIITARVQINGSTTGTFIVDTGASYVAMTEKFASSLNLTSPSSTVLVHTANGNSTAQLTSLDSVQVQELRANRVQAVILPDLGPGVDGLLGLSFLGRFKMVTTDGMLELSAQSAH